jgi:hypothetical protein
VQVDFMHGNDRPAAGHGCTAVSTIADQAMLLVRDVVLRAEQVHRLVIRLVDDRLLQREDVRFQRPETGLQHQPTRGPVSVLREQIDRHGSQPRRFSSHTVLLSAI